MTQTLGYTLHFSDLGISANHLAIALEQGQAELPEPYHDMIAELLAVADTLCSIQGGIKIYDEVEMDAPSLRIRIAGMAFHPQAKVFNHLRRSERIALFACTAGHAIGQRASHLMQNRDLMGGYIADTLGSMVVERAMDLIQEQFAHQMERQGLAITNRYSPGYCGWDVAEQQRLFQLLPQPFGGVTLSNSSLMSPIKSVSGMIGVGRNVTQEEYQCNRCPKAMCLYRDRN